MGRKLKAGIVGYGYMGKIRKAVMEEQPDLELFGICDTNLDLTELNPRYETFKYYPDLVKSDVDMIFVCTQNVYSPEIVIYSLNHGKHVFCEKPPGRTVADIKNIIQAEKSNEGLKLMFGFNHRYHPGIREAKVLLDSGRLGKIMFLKGTYGKSGGKNYIQSWRNIREISGGGILLDQGIHMLDLFRLFCGDFEEIKGFLSKMFWDTDVEDNAFVVLRNKSGQVATLHSSATLWKHSFKLEIFLEGGYLIVTGLLSKTGSYGRETLTIGKRQFEDESFALGNPREEVIYFDHDLSWSMEVEKFSEHIIQDKKVDTSSSNDALKVMELVDKIYRDEKIQNGSISKSKKGGKPQ